MKSLFLNKYTLIAGLIFAIYLIITLTMAASKESFSWSWWASIGDEKLNSSAKQIKMYGTNARVYGFNYLDPNTKINMHCLSSATTKGSGLSCWPSPKK